LLFVVLVWIVGLLVFFGFVVVVVLLLALHFVACLARKRSGGPWSTLECQIDS